MSNSTDPTESFAIRLKKAREARGLSQSELARKAGMVPSAIGHFEGDRRKPSFANVRTIAKVLAVSSDFLLGRSTSLEGATTAFRGEERLSSEDREWIQSLIDAKAKKDKQPGE